jgi:predicted ATP-dependent endonuclease of OLD family
LTLLCQGDNCQKFIKLADQLGIDWLVIADKDKAGDDYVRSATRQLNGRVSTEHVRQLPSGVIEAYLCSEGFGDIYKANISPQKQAAITEVEGTPAYWDQVAEAQSKSQTKPELAAAVISQIESAGLEAIPKLIREVIKLACKRAGVAG